VSKVPDRSSFSDRFAPRLRQRFLPVRKRLGRLADLGDALSTAADDHISWPTATRSAPDLACDAAGGYSVGAVIDGKEKVYGSIP
jgi:hypothetical protein